MTAVPKSGEVYYADDGTVSIVLDDNYDPNYDPPQKEVDEYARWLGIDVDTEKDLLFIARDGLKAPLPKEWKPCKTDTGEVYYFNFKTGESIWDHPMDDVYKKRVADERAKRGTSDGGGGKKGGGAKLVKGGAGSKQEPQAQPTAGVSRGRFTAAVEDVKPKTSRLGALGAAGNDGSSGKAARPDISDILPTKSDGVNSFLSTKSASNLLGLGKKEPLKDNRELERKFREKYQADFLATRQALKENHGKAIDMLREDLDNQLRRERSNLQTELEDEVEQIRRAAERRNKRELSIFEESIEKQKEDLRRTLRTLQEKYDSDSLGVSRRIENELSEKRNAASKNMAAEISRRRQELQEAWQREKVQVELRTQSTIHDMKATLDRQVAEMRARESHSVQERLAALEESLYHEQQQLRAALQAERAQHTAKLQAMASAGNAASSMEYASANADYQRAVEAAKASALSAQEQLRSAYKHKMAEVQREHDAKLAEAKESNAAMLQTNEREAVAQRTRMGQQRVAAAQQEQQARTAEEMVRYGTETTALVQHAKAQQQAAAAQARRQAESARAAVTQRHDAARREIEERHQVRADGLRNEHTAALAKFGLTDVTASPEFLSKLDAAKKEWLAKNPAPIYVLPAKKVPSSAPPKPAAAAAVSASPIVETVQLPPTAEQIAAFVEEAIGAERRKLTAEHDERLRQGKETVANDEKQYLQEHRTKAMNEISDRLVVYKQERLASPSRALLRQASASASSAGPVSPPKDLHGRVQHRREELRREYVEEEQALTTALQRAMSASSSSSNLPPAAVARGRPLSAEPLYPPVPEAELFQPAQQLRSSSANVRAMLPTAHVPPHQQHQQLQQHYQPQQYMQKHQQQQPQQQHPFPAGGTFIDTETIAALLHHVAAIASAQTTPSKQRKSHSGGGGGGGSHRHTTLTERIQTAHDMLRVKKKELRARQDQLEAARSDWKKDMAHAKQRRDGPMQEALAKVKTALEEEARQLNKEATALKESMVYLKNEEERLAASMSPPRPTTSSAAFVPPHTLPEGSQELQALVVQLLQKTGEMEQRLAAAERRAPPAAASGGPSPGRGKHQQGGHKPPTPQPAEEKDRMVDKWSSWLRENARSTTVLSQPPAMPPAMANAGAEMQATPKKDQVQKWLSEQP